MRFPCFTKSKVIYRCARATLLLGKGRVAVEQRQHYRWAAVNRNEGIVLRESNRRRALHSVTLENKVCDILNTIQEEPEFCQGISKRGWQKKNIDIQAISAYSKAIAKGYAKIIIEIK